MTTIISGDTGISPVTASGTSASVDGMTVGRGGGEVATNTAVGASALNSTTSGGSNTAVGYQSLYSNQTGIENTAVGQGALYSNTASNNTAVGRLALNANTTGTGNSALGQTALYPNTIGSYNTAVGQSALFSNTTASYNTAVGYQAGYTNTTSQYSSFFGYLSGQLTTGSNNTFVGAYSGQNTSSGTLNTFVGVNGAGFYVTTGSKNTILGGYNGNQSSLDIRTASNYIVLSDGDGNPRFYLNNSGYPFFPSIRGSAGTYAARFTGNTELTLDTSSARYKDNIRDSVYGLDDILKMQSRQFEYKDDGRSDVGFVAEEMVDVIPEVVAIDAQGRPDAVSYDRLVSVCVKAIQELKTIVDAQAAEITALKAKVG